MSAGDACAAGTGPEAPGPDRNSPYRVLYLSFYFPPSGGK